jgi:hypothetical protein
VRVTDGQSRASRLGYRVEKTAHNKATGVGFAELKVEAAGIEPAHEIDANDEKVSDCVTRVEPRAAPALHSGRPDWLELSSLDADLQSVVLAWEKISEPIRNCIVALVYSVAPESGVG